MIGCVIQNCIVNQVDAHGIAIMISKYFTSKVFHLTNVYISTESVFSKIFHF